LGLNAKSYITETSGIDVIKNHVDEHDIDLIMMGSHGTGGLKEAFLGSNTQRVLRTVSTPVLVIKNEIPVDFKKIVFEYSVKEGIDEGYLCPYIYHPIFIEFSQEEASSYIETVNKLAPDKRAIENNEIDKFLESIVSKLTKFQEIVKENITKNFTLFYCGEGYISFDGLERIRQLDAITMLLEKLDWRVGRITSEEKKSTREKVLKNLREKNLDAIASMRILDEGIDVPDCRYAYILASQRSERQAIQRRGRILRTSPGKINAELYDFIITGPKLTSKELENLYSREIKRAILFATDATNRDECLKAIYEV
jgi:superfamily II DNA or RNA helicase